MKVLLFCVNKTLFNLEGGEGGVAPLTLTNYIV